MISVTDEDGVYSNLLKDYNDSKGPIAEFPPKKISEYPTRNEVAQELDFFPPGSTEFTDVSYAISPGDYEYWISTRYLLKLLGWVAGEKIDGDLSVNNKDILKKKMREKAVRVSKETSELLIGWFGGGPQIRTKYQRTSSTFIILRVSSTADLKWYHRFIFHSEISVGEAKQEICEVFGVNPDISKWHDFYRGKCLQQIDVRKNLRQSLGDRHLLKNNWTVLDVRDGDGFAVAHGKFRGNLLSVPKQASTTEHTGLNFSIPEFLTVPHKKYMKKVLHPKLEYLSITRDIKASPDPRMLDAIAAQFNTLDQLTAFETGIQFPLRKIQRWFVKPDLSRNLEELSLNLRGSVRTRNLATAVKMIGLRRIAKVSFKKIKREYLMPLSLHFGAIARDGAGNRPICLGFNGSLDMSLKNAICGVQIVGDSLTKNITHNVALAERYPFHLEIGYFERNLSETVDFLTKYTTANLTDASD